MKSPICAVPREQTASFRIAGLALATAPLWLMLSGTDMSANAQTSDEVSNSSAVVASSAADWTQFHRDNMQRWNPYETILGVNNVRSLNLKWSFATTGVVESSPAVVNGVVYFGSDDHHVYALDTSTGTKLWSYATDGGNVLSSPAVADGIVYVGSGGLSFYALNATTGALLWNYPAIGALSSPAVANGVVYSGQGDGGPVFALDAVTGHQLQLYSSGDNVVSSPAVANGVVYFGDILGDFYAYELNGTLLWSFATGFYGVGSFSPAVADGVVYFGQDDGHVYALNASTGTKMWSYTTGGPVNSSPAVANGVVYIGSNDGNVYALNASTGAKLWSYFRGSAVYSAPTETVGVDSSPAVANGVVYVGSGNGTVYALNASTGAKLWSYATGSGLDSSPTVVDGVVYIGSAGGVLAFSLGSADLFLRLNASPEPIPQGWLLTYTFPIWNRGPNNADQEVLTTQVPEGTTFDHIRISGTPGLGTCTTPPYQGTGQIVCHENSAMAPNTTWTVRLTVKVTAPIGTLITESGTVTADTPDPDPANNTATINTLVE